MTQQIIYSCGHLGEIDLPLSATERERKLQWATEHGLCMDCYRRQRWPSTAGNSIQRPDIIDGHIWDGNVYGVHGRMYVYIDYERVNISDDMAYELRRYAQAVHATRPITEVQ